MSFFDWKLEFYEESAKENYVRSFDYKKNNSSKEQDLFLLDHCIKKWTGFLPYWLKKYNLRYDVDNRRLIDYDDPDRDPMIFGSTSCSLCYKYLDYMCHGCPVYESVNCSCSDQGSHYSKALETGNFSTMVNFLKSLKDYIKNNYEEVDEEEEDSDEEV